MSAKRGEVWLVDLDPVEGHEQGGRRPALVLSVDGLNSSRAGLVTVLPVTSRQRALRTRIEVRPPEGGLSVTSWVICEQARTVSTRRLHRRLGLVSERTMVGVADVVRVLLGL